MSADAAQRLASLEEDHLRAEEALAALRKAWRDEDEATASQRRLVLARHEQGALDRDAVRVRLGGQSLLQPEQPKPEDT